MTAMSLCACTIISPGADHDEEGKDINLSVANIKDAPQSPIENKTPSDPENKTNDSNVDQGLNTPDADTGNGLKNENREYPEYSVYEIYSAKDYIGDDYKPEHLNIKVGYTGAELYYTDDVNPFPELKEAVHKKVVEKREELEIQYADFQKDWEDDYGDITGDEEYFPILTDNVYDGVLRADDTVFSILRVEEMYTGGAHGGSVYTGFNFDSVSGEEIGLKDVVTNIDGLDSLIASELYKEYDPDIFYAFSKDELSDNIKTLIDEDQMVFTITYEGMILYFGDYVLAPYAAGHQEIYIKYLDHPEIFDKKYFENADTEYIIHVTQNTYFPFKVDGKDELLCMNWYKDYNENTGYFSEFYNKASLWSAGYDDGLSCDFEIGESISDPSVYSVRRAGKDYLYVQSHFYDGVEILNIYEFTDGKLVKKEGFDGGLDFNTNELKSTDYSALFFFGSNFEYATTTASINEDGSLKLEEKYLFDTYQYGYGGKYTAISDIDCFEADENDRPTEKKKVLKTDSDIYLYCTDGESYLTLISEDDEKYSFNITITDDDFYCNNERLDESFKYCFENG